MRKKAERKIRQSVLSLGKSQLYRIDKVRAGTDLIKKVFDKTVLDMARVGTIQLYEGDLAKISAAEVGNLIQKGDIIYLYFSFFESYEEIEARILDEETNNLEQTSFGQSLPIAPPPETISVTITGIEKAEWEYFNLNCLAQYGISGVEKLMEIIKEFNLSSR